MLPNTREYFALWLRRIDGVRRSCRKLAKHPAAMVYFASVLNTDMPSIHRGGVLGRGALGCWRKCLGALHCWDLTCIHNYVGVLAFYHHAGLARADERIKTSKVSS